MEQKLIFIPFKILSNISSVVIVFGRLKEFFRVISHSALLFILITGKLFDNSDSNVFEHVSVDISKVS